MAHQTDADQFARQLVADLRKWIGSERPERSLRAVTEALTAERDRAAAALAEGYRGRTDSLREALTERLSALASDEEPGPDEADPTGAGPLTAELERRVRVLEHARDRGTATAWSPERPMVGLPPGVDVPRQVQKAVTSRLASADAMRSGESVASESRKTRSGQKAEWRASKAEPPLVSVREIPGVGATLEARLKDAGVTDARAVAGLPPDQLAEVLQVSLKQAKRILEQALRVKKELR